jgi:hypothetical protein
VVDLHAAPGGQTGRNIDHSANDQPGLFMNKIQSLAAQNCNVALRVKAEAVPCVMQVSIGEKTQSVSVTNTDWAEIVLNAVSVPKGAGNLKYSVKEGTVNVDWAEFRTATENIAK